METSLQQEVTRTMMLAHWELQDYEFNADFTSMAWAPYLREQPGAERWGCLASCQSGQIGITMTSEFPRKPHLIRKSYNLPPYHTGKMVILKFNTEMGMLASCDEYGKVCLWSFINQMWQFKQGFSSTTESATDLIWSDDGRIIIICHPKPFLSVMYLYPEYVAAMKTFFNKNYEIKATFGLEDSIAYITMKCGKLARVNLSDGLQFMELSKLNFGAMDQILFCKQNGAIAISSSDGLIHVIRNIQDTVSQKIETHFLTKTLQWSNSGRQLGVLGIVESRNCSASLKIYNTQGQKMYTLPTFRGWEPWITPQFSLEWGHEDTRVFVATGSVLKVAAIGEMSLEEISALKVCQSLKNQDSVNALILPPSSKLIMQQLLTSSIENSLSSNHSRWNFEVIISPVEKQHGLVFCTLHCKSRIYHLYMEHLGGTILLLKAYPSLTGKSFVIKECEPTKCERQVAKVKANIRGTKFKIYGLEDKYIGKIQYKTGCLLAPKKIIIKIPNPTQPTLGDTVICNKSPRWNEDINMYEYDSDGRYFKASEKNCRFDYDDMKVLQLGRVGKQEYFLDFGYPLSGIHAFAVALSNITPVIRSIWP